MHKIRIEMTDHARGQVYIDDVEVQGVTSIKFEAKPDAANAVHLEIFARELIITGPAEIVRDFTVIK